MGPLERAATRRWRWVPPILAAVFIGFAVFTSVSARNLVRDQERRLVQQKSAEVGALLRNMLSASETSLRILNGVGPSPSAELSAAYTRAATPLLRNSTVSVRTVVKRPDGYSLVAGVGNTGPPGSRLAESDATVAERALSKQATAFGVDEREGAVRFVLAVPSSEGSGIVSLQESNLDPSTPVPQPKGSPFAEMRVAMYAERPGEPDALVLTTEKRLPLGGTVVRSELPLGSDRFRLAVSPRQPLVGGVAARVPYVRLGGGLVAAFLAWAIAHVLNRRRDYALQLVEERTAELESSVNELGETRAFLERMLTSGPLVVVRADMSSQTVTYVSPNMQRLFGHTDAMARASKFLANHTHPDDLPTYRAALEAVGSGRATHAAAEVRLRNSAGEFRWVATELVPELASDGRVAAVITYVLDVDDRRRAQEAQRAAQEVAEKASQAKSEFLSHMSHELRTPLNAILGFGQVLEMEDITAGQREAVEHILVGGRHLLSLINEVLDISRIETGDLAFSPEVVSPGELVQESLELIKPIADQRGVTLTTSEEPCECAMYADRQRVKQVLLNLLSNAVKYNHRGGTVTVSTHCRDDGRIAIAVRDTGIGIEADRLSQLFVPFERLGAENTDVEGTGIGLTLAQQLATAMGGLITVTSEPGSGSTFTVALPSVTSSVGSNDYPDDLGIRRRSNHVLHIEDNLANLKLVEQILARRGDFDVIPAMSGSLGLELAREHRPMLVLLDLHLPDISGEEVLRRLRAEPSTAGIPVVVLSADASAGQAQRLLAAGAHAYLTKPVDVPQLLGVLNEAFVAQQA